MLTFELLPVETRQMISRELRDGESVTWVDQPIPLRLGLKTWPLVLFAIPWTAFSLFWEWGALQAAPQARDNIAFIVFPLFGLPFVLLGLAMLTAPLWAALKAKRMFYVLTTHRALLLHKTILGKLVIRPFEVDQLNSIERSQHTDGSGDLIFKRDMHRDSEGDVRHTAIGFVAVPDVKQVHERINQLLTFAAKSNAR